MITNRSKKTLACLVILVLLISNTSFTQSGFPNLTFRTLTTKDGLTHNSVNYITQGDDGQMWLGTPNGLNSYDGNRFTTYYSGNAAGIKLNQNGIHTMLKDSSNNLWISDRVGLTKISLNNYNTTYYNQFQTVHKLAHFRKGIIFACDAGIFTIMDTTITHLNVPFEPYLLNSDIIEQYNRAIKDRKENMYLVSNIRVHKIGTDKTEIKFYQIPNKLTISDLFFDIQNTGWVGTWFSGLYRFEPELDSLQQIFKPEHSESITGPFAEWKLGKTTYLVARVSTNYESGIVLINPSTLQYRFYNLNANVSCIFVDKSGNLWLGLERNGVLIASHLHGGIETIPIVSSNYYPQNPNPSIYTIHETAEHFWLNKRYYHGIFKFDKKWNKLKEFGPYSVENIYQYNEINDGYDFKLVGNTMYATNELGIFLINNSTHERKQIFTPERAEVKLRTIVPVNDSTWFIRSFSRGIYVFNPKTNAFITKYEIPKTSTNFGVNFLIKTKNDCIVASTNQGFYLYDPKLDKFNLIDHAVLKNLYIFGMAEDQNNLLWLGTSKGLISYDLSKNQIISEYNEYSEMGTAYRVAVDPKNNVWFSNAKGYWCWNQKKQSMLKLNFESGIITDTDEPYIHVSYDGHVYLGGKNVIYKLDPNSLSADTISYGIIISGIYVNNEFRIPYSDKGDYQINLPPGSAAIQVEFSVPDYTLQNCYDYKFKLSDSELWSDSKDGKIFIPNLSYGKHHILMKGISSFSGDETEISNLHITIQPHWYQTWWFKSFMFLATLSIIYLFYRRRLASEKEKNKIKAEYENRMIHLEMQNLRSQMNPHFIFNALNSINGFIVENQTNLASEYLTKFSKLIRMILDHSKSDLISLTKELEALKLYVMMEKNRFDQVFDFDIHISEGLDTDHVGVPPLILQPYVENAIWHGLMHQSKKGLITISIDLLDDRIFFTIVDNGVGMKRAHELKSKKNIKTNSYGMKITQTRIKDHHDTNEVIVSDVINEKGEIEGTKITISLKVI